MNTKPLSEELSPEYIAEAERLAIIAEAEAMKLPEPGSPIASAMMDSALAEYNYPSNPKNAARAGWVAAQRWLATRPRTPQPKAPPSVGAVDRRWKDGRQTTAQLFAAAQRDSDAVSVFEDGSEPGEADRAIIVVKGRENIDYLRSLCERQGLLTDKPVEPS